MHTFKHGLESRVISDAGSQIVAGTKTIVEHLCHEDSVKYLQEHGIESLDYSQFSPGCEKLGGLVEILVKLVKRVLSGAFGRKIPSIEDFEYAVAETKHIVNKRPISFLESLQDTESSELPIALTPEMILHGYELVSPNIIPDLEKDPEDWLTTISPTSIFTNLLRFANICTNL